MENVSRAAHTAAVNKVQGATYASIRVFFWYKAALCSYAVSIMLHDFGNYWTSHQLVEKGAVVEKCRRIVTANVFVAHPASMGS
jgi:hypothetical protein